MKKLFLSLFIATIVAACTKDPECKYDECNITAPAAEIQSLQAYLTSNGIAATQHCSGIFYVIDQQGSGEKAGPCEEAYMRYEGRLTNGTVFDSSAKTNPTYLPLDRVVTGFRNGMIQVRPGGKMRLYIPPSLGYGSSAQGPIPANSVLIFNVELISTR